MRYIGERVVDVKSTKYSEYTPSDWVMYFVERYGQIDGGHHKKWVLDQIARILKGCPIIVKEAKWDNGLSEWRISTGEPSEKYLKWVDDMKQDGEYDSYDEGIAP